LQAEIAVFASEKWHNALILSLQQKSLVKVATDFYHQADAIALKSDEHLEIIIESWR
jgi:hypothetical protein